MEISNSVSFPQLQLELEIPDRTTVPFEEPPEQEREERGVFELQVWGDAE